ncbi:hypothetical protein [Nonomuraea sp. NPDC049028]|uniref:hypothetical protein n=1 Tax=Nonomuraea sp. NPDC049028 TaxID=3364348 RepID=UPI00371F2E5D
MRRELIGTLEVPDGKRVSTLEWMRTPVTELSGTGMSDALDRTSYVLGLGAGVVDLSAVAPVKLAELASYGLHAKAAKIKQLQGERRVATLVATSGRWEVTRIPSPGGPRQVKHSAECHQPPASMRSGPRR